MRRSIPALVALVVAVPMSVVHAKAVVYLTPEGTIDMTRTSPDSLIKTPAVQRMQTQSRKMSAVYVLPGTCSAQAQKEFRDHGIRVTDAGNSAAVMELQVSTDEKRGDPDSVSKGNYVASLRDAEGMMILTTSGQERAHDLDSVCDDIGDTLADRLENRFSR